MPRLAWDSVGSRFYESGIERGVLYVDANPGVPWNGLTSVAESSTGGEAEPFYVDGYKFLNVSSPEEFEATITAFTYPDEFAECEGSYQSRSGLFVTQQGRKSFGLSYRTKIGNDQSSDYGYKIHIIYNALAAPSERANATLTDSTDPDDFSWKITSRPPQMSGYRPTSHIVIDSRTTDPSILGLIEDALYGTDEEMSRLPSLDELVEIFDAISTLTVVDNGDGTWTATAPYDVIRMLDDTTFQITAPTAVYIDEDSYTISSA